MELQQRLEKLLQFYSEGKRRRLAGRIKERDPSLIAVIDGIVKDAHYFFDGFYNQDTVTPDSRRKQPLPNANFSDYGELMVEVGKYFADVGKNTASGKFKEFLPKFRMMELLAYREAFNNFTNPLVMRDKEAKELVEGNPELKQFRSLQLPYFGLCLKYPG